MTIRRVSIARAVVAILYCCSFGLAVAPAVALIAWPFEVILPRGYSGAAVIGAFWFGIPWGILLGWSVRGRTRVHVVFLVAGPLLAMIFAGFSEKYRRLAEANRGGILGGFGDGMASTAFIIATFWCGFWVLTGLLGLLYGRLRKRDRASPVA